MPKIAIMPVLFFVCALLCACGPKEIGEGSSYQPQTRQDAATAENMRYPLTGSSRTQQMLYYQSRPDVVQNYQIWKLHQFRRAMGVTQDPQDPAYREKPRQRSPFRQ